MIRVTGFYRWQEGASFDHEYYHKQHMELTREQLAPFGLLRLESDTFLNGKPIVVGEIIAASYAYFESVEKAQAAMAAAGPALLRDVPTYTTLKPELRLSVVTTHV